MTFSSTHKLSPLEFDNVLTRCFLNNPSPPSFKREIRTQLVYYEFEVSYELFVVQLVNHVRNTSDRPNDPARVKLHAWIIRCDGDRQADQDWAKDSEANSIERRQRVYDAIEIGTTERETLNEFFPPRLNPNPLIAVPNELWLDNRRKHESAYYSSSLRAYLAAHGWSPENLGLLDQATDDIIANLGDPSRCRPDSPNPLDFAGRGLVVGYVQSGKTTTMNMTIAKAVDMGYRLVIVLAGLTDLLRRQTQRRIDKEVVGQAWLKLHVDEFESEGYLFAPDWSDFIEHPTPPAGFTPRTIERLTTLQYDFSRGRGVQAFPPGFLNNEDICKIVVIKKNASRLKNLIREIERGIPDHLRRNISALILDDESDQATVNTVDPRKQNETKRSAINRHVIHLLQLLPNAQYVGVTATPVANCFTDPTYPEDIYPRHFIYPLERPDGYMGIMDFHDLTEDLVPIPDHEPQPKKDQHIRDILLPRGEDDDELLRALDSFVISGALKLYRRKTSTWNGKHHTLFYSDSTFKADMSDAKERVERLWNSAAYHSKRGLDRLREIYEGDFIANSPYSQDTKYFPATFESLIPDISEAVRLIDEPFDGHSPVLVVNSEQDSPNLDFQVIDIWKVIVGGMKLSRGFTIEGLTVTYFRRKSTNEAAMMQMGRWFGYRAGYRDLVRLFISRREPARPAEIDIYDVYESVCIDEERLRRKFIDWYQTRREDGSKVTPLDIRPLISTVDQRLSPVARNQMWNAEIVWQTFSGPHENRYFSDASAERSFNENLWKTLLQQYGMERIDTGLNRVVLFSRDIPKSDMIRHLEAIKRPSDGAGARNDDLFHSFLRSEKCRVDTWSIVIPQLRAQPNGIWVVSGNESATLHQRGWKQNDPSRGLKTIGDPTDRDIAKLLTSDEGGWPTLTSRPHEVIRNLASSTRGVILLYPITTIKGQQLAPPILGFESYLPAHPSEVGFRVREPRDISNEESTSASARPA